MFFADDSSQLGTQNAGTVIRGSDPSFIFPNWNSIKKQDFDDFFEYIQKVWDLTKDKQTNDNTKWKWPYLSEIAPYKLPFCMVIWFYYKNHYRKFIDLKRSFEEQKKLELQSKSMRIPLEELKNRMDVNEVIDFDAAETISVAAEFWEIQKNAQKRYCDNRRRDVCIKVVDLVRIRKFSVLRDYSTYKKTGVGPRFF